MFRKALIFACVFLFAGIVSAETVEGRVKAVRVVEWVPSNRIDGQYYSILTEVKFHGGGVRIFRFPSSSSSLPSEGKDYRFNLRGQLVKSWKIYQPPIKIGNK